MPAWQCHGWGGCWGAALGFVLAGTGAGGSLGEGGPTPAQGRGVLHQRHDPVLPGSSSSGQDREWVPRGGSPGASGRSDPILKSLQPSCRTGHHSWVGMWHPEGMAPYFGGGHVRSKTAA